jgi:UDP-N-acetylmuramyl pentapeptide phosphotransferase/UDP-N-acetylglucosamine-1-phosphate transferase
MIIFYKIVFGTIFHSAIIFFARKYNILLDDKKFSVHKKLASPLSSVLTGGIVFSFLFFFYVDDFFIIKFFCICIFFVGFFSDIKLINNPYLRLILQTAVLSGFVFINKININSTDLYYLDILLKNEFFSYLFTIFCFLILINGTNFVDGLNTLVIGYYIICLLALLFFITIENINYNNNLIINVLIILFINYLFNFSGKNYLGDSGAYVVAFVVGYIIVDFYSFFNAFSALFIVILLWYPAFETFFSIVRKKILKKNPYKPDNRHLHQLIFLRLCDYIDNKKISNTLTATIINLYNLLVIIMGLIFHSSSSKLSVLIFLNILFYLVIYNYLDKKIKTNTF